MSGVMRALVALCVVTAGLSLLATGADQRPPHGGMMAAGVLLVALAVLLVFPRKRRRR